MVKGNIIQKILSFLSNIKIALAAYLIITIAVSIIQFYNPDKRLKDGSYTSYNNYIVFKQSFHHLIDGKDLYKAYPEEYWDLFKYSPFFALFMGLFTMLPDVIGLAIWNLLNSLLLFYAIKSLPALTDQRKSYLLWAILPELLITLQNSQSNALTAAFMIFTFSFFEKRNVLIAALMVIFAFCIKIYGCVAAILFIFYPQKIKFVIYGIVFFILSGILPLLFVSPEQLLFLYKSWIHILKYDIDTSVGLSVMGWIQTWFNADPHKNIVLAIGFLLMMAPLVKMKMFSEINYRINYIAALMIWVIIFNHRSESPTFIIAMTGAALWYFISGQKAIHTFLFVLAFLFSSLSPTDLFPATIRINYVVPYVLKVVPFVFIWLFLVLTMLLPQKKILNSLQS